MAAHPFVVVPALAAIAVAYKQGNLIADQVMPRVPVMTETFRYPVYALGDAFRAPETLVGRKSAPNQIDWSATEATAAVKDYGLDAPVPNADIKAWEMARAAGATHVSTVDPLGRATRLVTQTVQNRREKRVADMITNPASYATANKTTLSGTSQWSDFANSDPVGAIKDALDSMVMRPNFGTFNRKVWNRLSRHPGVRKAVYGDITTKGSVQLRALADELELQEIFVGEAWIDTAAPGQTSALQRCWGNHAAFFYRAPSVDSVDEVTFGCTAQYGDKIAGTIDDPDIGLRGGVRVRSGESLVELITAGDLGYLFTNAVA